MKLADAIRKLAEHAERNGIELDMDVQVKTNVKHTLRRRLGSPRKSVRERHQNSDALQDP